MKSRLIISLLLLISIISISAYNTDNNNDDNWFGETIRRSKLFSSSNSNYNHNKDFNKYNSFQRNNNNPAFHGAFISSSISHLSRTAQEMIESGAATKLSYGFAVGYCSGYCVRKVAKATALLIGGTVILIQTLSHRGYVDINRDRVKNDVNTVLDLNQDGEIDERDAQFAYNKVNAVLGQHIPTGGGFSAGLFFGLRH